MSTIDTITVAVDADTAGFESGIAGVVNKLGGAGTLALTGAAVAAGAAIAKFTSDSLGYAKELETAMTDFQTQTGASAEEAEAFSGTLRELYRSNTDSVEDLASAATLVSQRLAETGEELGPLTQSFLDFAKVTGQDTTKAVDELADVMVKMGIETEDAAGLMDSLLAAAQATGVPIEELQGALAESATQFAAMGYTGDEAVAMLAAFDAAGMDAGSTARALNGFFSRTNELTDEQASALGRLGAEMDVVSIATEKTVERANEHGIVLAEGQVLTDDLRQELLELGIGFDNNSRMAGTHREALEGMFAEMSGGEPTVEMMQDAMTIFGTRVGPELVSALQSGQVGIEELMAIIEDSEGTVSAASDVYDKQLGERWTLITRNYLEPFMHIIGHTLLDVLQSLLDFVEMIGPKISAVWAAVLAFFTGFAGSMDGETSALGSALRDTWEALRGAVEAVFDALVALWTNVLKPTWDAIQPFVEVVFAGVVLAIQNALAIITGVLNALVALLTGDFVGAWDAMRTMVESIMDNLRSFLATAFGAVFESAQTQWSAIRDAIISPIEQAWEWLVATWEAIREFLGSMWDAIGVFAGAAFGVVRDNIMAAFTGLGEFVQGVFAGAVDAIGSLIDGIVARIQSAWDSLRGLGEAAANATADAYDSLGAPDDVVDSIRSGQSPAQWAWDRVMGRNNDEPMALGGIVTAPTRALIGEAGPEAVIPLDRLDQMLNTHGGSGGDMTVYVELDGRVIATAVAPRMIDQVRLKTGLSGAL